uniref:LEM domain-containing protein 1 isoform X2 n=1 Tax=Jaculus jaculus TaxID=51337 RepID=UPI001E1AFAC0|nr:LEM domain-containing protein 1 isoform X2 [Jaculus jaculus]
MVDVQCLSDCELHDRLEKLGFSPGPILQLNIILKGNITLSTEKGKESKKRPKPSISKRTLDICCLGQKPRKGIRCAARSPNTRMKHECITKGKDYCSGKHGCATKGKDNCPRSKSPESGLPWSLKLAIFGIFIIVMFVYITVEKKPVFG